MPAASRLDAGIEAIGLQELDVLKDMFNARRLHPSRSRIANCRIISQRPIMPLPRQCGKIRIPRCAAIRTTGFTSLAPDLEGVLQGMMRPPPVETSLHSTLHGRLRNHSIVNNACDKPPEFMPSESEACLTWTGDRFVRDHADLR